MKWKVKLTIRRMGRQCRSCKQVFECEVSASNEVEAAQFAKSFLAQIQKPINFQSTI
ncbi:hypothetical protein [Enterobacter phage N5822]|nr:hypothetical protein [Enterobacter phage N5822]